MTCLADTQIILWWFFEPKRIPENIMKVLADEECEVFYSPVSLWEIAIKYSLGKLELGRLKPEEFFIELDGSFFKSLALDNADIITSYKLVRHHGDPFDRMLAWIAIQKQMTLLSADTSLRKYVQNDLKLIF